MSGYKSGGDASTKIKLVFRCIVCGLPNERWLLESISIV